MHQSDKRCVILLPIGDIIKMDPKNGRSLPIISHRAIIDLANKLYGKNSIQADAFRHILAGAYYTTILGPTVARLGGYVVEIIGAIKVILLFKGISSGWKMDIKNNSIGIDLGRQDHRLGLNELAKKVKMIIDEGNFYIGNGRLYKEGLTDGNAS